MMPKNHHPFFPPTNQVVINQKIEPVIARPCHPCQPVIPQAITKTPHEIPTSGSLQGNGFRLISQTPYLIDTTQMLFGAKINVGDNVYTRITKRSDLGCVDLSARIDMTTSMHTDTALVKYLNDTISQSYETLQQYLPMIQSLLVCTLEYDILDQNGGVVTSGNLSGTTENVKFHETNINDYYLTSAYSTMIGDILPMGYSGIYFLQLKSFSVSLRSFNTIDHLDAGLNPFYAFSDDYSSIYINHEAVDEVTDDITLLPLVETQFTEGNIFEFEANIATRFKFTYEAYMSDMIWEPNTYETYQALYNPAQQRITALEQAVAELKTTVESLESRVTALEAIHPTVVYEADKQLYTGQLVWQTYGDLYQATTDFVASGDFDADVEAGNMVRLRGDNS